MKRSFQRGFTLIELMVVISIIIILLSLAMPRYQKTIVHAQETALRDDLHTLRSVIDQYTLDKQKAPKSLDELKSAGYIEKVPDDITGSQSWVVEEDDTTILSIYQKEGGMYGVHSGSSRTGSNGKPYSEW